MLPHVCQSPTLLFTAVENQIAVCLEDQVKLQTIIGIDR